MSYVSTSVDEASPLVPAAITPAAIAKSDSLGKMAGWKAAAISGAETRGAEAAPSRKALTPLHRWLRQRFERQMHRLAGATLELRDADGVQLFGVQQRGNQPTGQAEDGRSTRNGSIDILDPRVYQMAATGGGLGAAESYIRGYWETPDLVSVMRTMSHHSTTMADMENGFAKWKKPFDVVTNWFRRNSRSGSRRNISAHYDLSNEFFALMLDPTMTYSSGIFTTPETTLEESSIEKYDRICRQLQLTETDRVLEIGCGWGGFAIYAATNYGCHVTATTISAEQHRYAANKIKQAGLEDRITLLNQDYRDLRGKFDKLVSIEMIEAVGERYLNQFFRQCSERLTSEGMMLLQAITIPDDRYGQYRRSVDFIRRYVFPGGFLPSFSAIGQSIKKSTDFRIAGSVDFGLHYGETLARWRSRFWSQIDRVRGLGFDERFERTWDYYLCYCEAGFRERQIGVSQMLFLKPQCRSEAAGIPLYQSNV